MVSRNLLNGIDRLRNWNMLRLLIRMRILIIKLLPHLLISYSQTKLVVSFASVQMRSGLKSQLRALHSSNNCCKNNSSALKFMWKGIDTKTVSGFEQVFRAFYNVNTDRKNRFSIQSNAWEKKTPSHIIIIHCTSKKPSKLFTDTVPCSYFSNTLINVFIALCCNTLCCAVLKCIVKLLLWSYNTIQCYA